jgi:peptide-methionine (S)-S-oxide reductase
VSEKATFGGGCFWCMEAIFQRLNGVGQVLSGYSGGTGAASYSEVSMGTTGHAESIQVEFDPAVISYRTILEVFFDLHDPTTLNQQGADIGTQYRSIVFFHNKEQKETTEKIIKEIDKSGKHKNPVVTELVPFENFVAAENYHQDYYNNNKEAAYCKVVIDPKITKLYKHFPAIVKNE